MIHILYSNLFATPDKLKEIIEETDKGESLQLVKQYVKWMTNKQTKDTNRNYKILAH